MKQLDLTRLEVAALLAAAEAVLMDVDDELPPDLALMVAPLQRAHRELSDWLDQELQETNAHPN